MRMVVEEPTESPAPSGEAAAREAVYVAVKNTREAKANLAWALQNTSRETKVVIVHVHRPAQKIPTALGWFPASQMQEKEVKSYRDIEREKMLSNLDELGNQCSLVKLRRTEKLVIEKDDVSKGLVELIASHGITKLVMGAAADRTYTRKMRAPKSKTALVVQQQADPSCKIWFVCKGNLICPRDASLDEFFIAQSPTRSPDSLSSRSAMQRSRSLYQAQENPLKLPGLKQDIFTQRSRSADFTLCTELTMAALPIERLVRSSIPGYGEASNITGSTDVSPRGTYYSEFDHFPVMAKDADRNNGPPIPTLIHDPEEECVFQYPQHEPQVLGVDGVMYERVQAALSEAENSKREAYEEFCKRQRAEKDLNEAMRRVKIAQSLYTKEVNLRREIEETLTKGKIELSTLKQQEGQVYEELQKARQKMETLHLQISDSDQTLEDVKGKLSEAYAHLNSIREENEVLQQQRDNIIRENEVLCQNQEDATTSTSGAETFTHFSRLELEQATENFNGSLKIGEGGYGCVYKGYLRHTLVAIKRLDPQGMQGKAEFQREFEVLSKIRHPNLVALIGACPEEWTLVYEYLPNGSLEDRLTCLDDTSPLTWQDRVRIATEICSALIFLHSYKSLRLVHGDLKPANILLDENFVSKLGDYGICRLLIQSINSTTLYHCTRQPMGTFAYMDPELISSGEITTKSDVYSFGVILLRLLTGRRPFGLGRAVQDALDTKSLDKILDVSAGDWPYVLAEQLAKLGLRCCEMKRRNRLDAEEAWKILEPLAKSMPFEGSSSSSSFRSVLEDSRPIPSYFICPIYKELMRDPQTAADGFTYEAEAIKGWLYSGRDTSPMTNLKLSNHELTPNYALRSAILEWLQQYN